MTSSEKIVALRQKMSENNIDAFIVYSADPHMSEYLPEEWQERSWLSSILRKPPGLFDAHYTAIRHRMQMKYPIFVSSGAR